MSRKKVVAIGHRICQCIMPQGKIRCTCYCECPGCLGARQARNGGLK